MLISAIGNIVKTCQNRYKFFFIDYVFMDNEGFSEDPIFSNHLNSGLVTAYTHIHTHTHTHIHAYIYVCVCLCV